MEQFYDNTNRLPPDQRNNKFNQIIGFLRQNNLHGEADTFLELKNCYQVNSFMKEDNSFRIYLAWCKVYTLPNNKIIRHIVSQG